MKKHIISMILIFITLSNCKPAHSNGDEGRFTKAENTIDTLSNDAKCKFLVKKDVEIKLDTILRIEDDTLHVNYKVTNNTIKNLLFFHLGCLGMNIKGNYPETDYPYCSALIINSKNEFPMLFKSNMGPRKEKKDCNPYSYVLLLAGESITFHREIYIGNYHLLGKVFKVKLKYSSPYNKIFINKFKRMQSKNPKLKDYERFEGVIESNLCPLTLHR